MELRDYLTIIRARRWRLVSIVVIVVAIALISSTRQKPTYQGHAEVIVSGQNTGAILLGAPTGGYQSIDAIRAEVQTQVRVIQSPRVAQQVIKALGLTLSPDSVLERVTAANDGQTNVVTIDALDASPEGAARLANAFATAYVDWSQESKIASIKAAGDDVQRRLAAAQKQIVALTPRRGTTATAERQVELDAAKALYASLADKLEQLRINQQLETGSGSILTSAVADPAPVSPRPARDGALGLAVGLALGLGAVFLAEQMDTKIRSAEQASEIYGAPVLASIPTDTFSKKDASQLTLIQHPKSPAADAYRSLGISLDFARKDRDVKTVIVTSAAPSEGKSTVAANLAIALAQAGKRVVILNCDFHRPAGATFAECTNGHIGLGEILTAGRPAIDAFQRPAGIDRLVVVASGTTPPNPSDLLGSSRMQALVAELRESMDWVIMDAPPLLAVADATALARWADGALIVTHVGTSTLSGARRARAQLEKIGARILGISAWGIRDTAETRAYSGYYNSH